MPLACCGHPCDRCWWFISERGVWSDGVVVDAPAFGQHAKLFDGGEDFSVEELVSEFGVERFTVSVLPRRAGFDIQRLCTCVRQPCAKILGDELGTIVNVRVP